MGLIRLTDYLIINTDQIVFVLMKCVKEDSYEIHIRLIPDYRRFHLVDINNYEDAQREFDRIWDTINTERCREKRMAEEVRQPASSTRRIMQVEGGDHGRTE